MQGQPAQEPSGSLWGQLQRSARQQDAEQQERLTAPHRTRLSPEVIPDSDEPAAATADGPTSPELQATALPAQRAVRTQHCPAL